MRRLALLLVVLVLVVGCSAQHGPDDAELARSWLLTRADLGPGWRAVDPPRGPSIADACPGSMRHRSTGHARSKRFQRGGTTIENGVVLWADDAAAQRALTQVLAEPTLRCVERLMERTTKANARNVDHVDVHVSRATAGSWGDARGVVDATVTEVRGSEVVTFHFASAFIRSGRTTVQLSFGAWPGPAVPDRKVIDLVLRRIHGEQVA